MLLDADGSKDMILELDVLNRIYEVCPVRSLYLSMVWFGLRPAFPKTSLHFGLHKVARLIDEVEADGNIGEPESILQSCERFARYKGQWLKVAGFEKAEILTTGFRCRPLLPHELITEFGVFVGYTAVRLGDMVRTHGEGRVISLEVNPIHVCVARHLLDLAALSPVSEVRPGQAKDALPWISEECGSASVGFSFMDHRGTIFHKDFALLERKSLFAPRSRFIADNTLNPGAPQYLWMQNFQLTSTRIVQWALTEFLAEHEDWTAVSDIDTIRNATDF